MNKEIIDIREKNGLSINDLANKLNISESMIRKVESGYRRPSVMLAKRWALELKIPESKIFKYFFCTKQDNMCKIKLTKQIS